MKTTYIAFPAQGVVETQTEELDTSNLGPMEVVLENEATLVSAGTELARLNGLEIGGDFPCRPGYAAIGRILEKGSDVQDFEVGDRVFYAGSHASHQRFEHGQDHQWGRLYPVPEGIAPEDAVYACLAQIAKAAPATTPIDMGDSVAVFGLGLIGNLAAQLYQIMGAHVIGLDPVEKRCKLAKEVGIEQVSAVAPDQQVDTVMSLTNGQGADICVEAVGHSAVVANAIESTRLFGQVSLLGSPRAPFEGNLTEAFQAIHMNGLVVRGAHLWRFPAYDMRGAKKTVEWGYRNMFNYIQTGQLKIGPLRSHIAEPAQAAEIYDGLQNKRDTYWGVVFRWK